jgi:hypothetical protein
MPRRWSTVELASFYFKPFQLHLQTSDLLEQLVLAGLGGRRIGIGLAGEHFRQPLRHLLLPLAHLHRMHPVLGGDRVDRLDPLQGIEPDLGFESEPAQANQSTVKTSVPKLNKRVE